MRISTLNLAFTCLLLGMVSSCYQEEIIYYQYEDGVLNFSMTEEQENRIYNSRGMGNKVYIDEPLPLMHMGDETLEINQFATRGQNTLNFRKKSFSVNLDKIVEWRGNNRVSRLEKFKLMSLVYDYTYIENNFASKIYGAVGLWPFHTFFTEVALNGNHQGIYFFVPDPEDYCIDVLGANFVLRKDYHNDIRRCKVSSGSVNSEQYYRAKYDSVYTIIATYSGEELYNQLSKKVDLENYFRKLTIDFLMRNGDYTDELYFYTTVKNGYEVFSPIPWDCDDIFSDLPHEINRSWAPGPLFGRRAYNSMDEVRADVGDRLLFSIEEDLDYIIAKDEFLYSKYLEQMVFVLNVISEQRIRDMFDEAYTDVEKYYQSLDLEELSQYDENSTSIEKLRDNVAEMTQLVINQRRTMQQKIDSL